MNFSDFRLPDLRFTLPIAEIQAALNNPKIVFVLVSAIVLCLVLFIAWYTHKPASFEAAVKSGSPVRIRAYFKNTGLTPADKNADGMSFLFRAIQNRATIGILNWLVKKGGDLHDRNNRGESAFAVAIIHKNAPDVLRWLKHKGLDVNERGLDGLTPLMIAVQENTSVKIVDTLLDMGARVSDRADFGITPLMLAAGRNLNPYILLTLLKHGAGLNDRSAEGATPLMLAAGLNPNAVDIVEVLLDCGANAGAKDKEGRTAIDYAKNNPALTDTETFWRLNNASYD